MTSKVSRTPVSTLFVTLTWGYIDHNRVRLKRGILKAEFLAGSLAEYASQRARSSAFQLNPEIPTLLLLPAEVLKMVLGYLEPIWLFQAEAAYPEIAALSSSLNSVWYDILPHALFAEPEHFQDEAHVELVHSKLSRGEVDLDRGDDRHAWILHGCGCTC